MMRFSCVCVTLAALAACESSPDLPTAAEGPPPFSRITWDRTTLSPAPGSSFQVGQPFSYRADAFFEISPEDMAEDPTRVAVIYLEARDSYESWGSESWYDAGDLDRVRVFLPEGVSSGFIGLEGSITVPEVSPYCWEYDEIRLRARVVAGSVVDTLDSEKTAPGTELTLPFPVSGTDLPQEPCVVYDTRLKEYDWAWGELVRAEIHHLGAEQQVTFQLGDGPRQNFLLGAYQDDFLTEVTYAETFLPVGSEGGDFRVYVDGELAIPGGGLWDHYRIPEPRDFGDPDNDRWNDPQDDNLWLWGTPIAFYGRELAFTPLDREPAPELNPFGWDQYGRGDWWYLFLSSDHISQLCVLIQHATGSADEADLFLTTSMGELLQAERYPGEDWQWLFMPVPEGPHTFYLWAAPKNIDSEFGRYWLTAAECSWYGSPAAVAMGGSMSSRDPPVPAGVTR